MWVLLLACAPAPPPPTEATSPAEEPEHGPVLEFVLDPGTWTDGEWVSTEGADELVSPAPLDRGAGAFRRFAARVDAGAGLAVVRRAGCGSVEVPFAVGLDHTVLLPYPACAPADALPLPGSSVRLDRAEVTLGELARMRVVDASFVVDPTLPEDTPAVWVSWAMAHAWCAWNGARLPTEAEWRAASPGPPRVSDTTRTQLGPGPRPAPPTDTWVDLTGNVSEWLADGRVAGGSWVSRADELGVATVPREARADTIGFRCAHDAPAR